MEIENIYNFNKTSFRIRIEKSQIIIIEEIILLLYQTNANNKDYIILIKCVSNLNYTLPSILILAER